MSNGEIELWVRLTSREFVKNKKSATNLVEMYRFIACIFAVKQEPKKGGIIRAFDESNDGLFPALNLGRFGLKHWCWKEKIQHWTYAELAPGMTEDDMDPYWKTVQLIEHLNNHYRRNFEHGWKVTVDERIFWGYMWNQPGDGHKCERTP
eukprot:6531542-Ditylum_brightwellii.AAC.1